MLRSIRAAGQGSKYGYRQLARRRRSGLAVSQFGGIKTDAASRLSGSRDCGIPHDVI
jgi:hypothetical protein